MKWISISNYLSLRDSYLTDLLNQYNSLDGKSRDKPKRMGMSKYDMEIMFYLAGMPEKVHSCDFHKIQGKVAKLGIPIRPLS